jgi:hypothetical protein
MKNLNESINRINHLMGNKYLIDVNDIISEQLSAFRYLDDIIKNGGRHFDDIISRARRDGKITDAEEANLKRYLNQDKGETVAQMARRSDSEEAFLRNIPPSERNTYKKVFQGLSSDDKTILKNKVLQSVYDRNKIHKETFDRFRDHALGTYQQKFQNGEKIDNIKDIIFEFEDAINNNGVYADSPEMINFLKDKLLKDPDFKKFVSHYKKNIKNPPDWVDTISLGSNVKDIEAQPMKNIQKFYLDYLELPLRNFLSGLGTIKDLIRPESLENAINKFDNDLKLALDEVLKGGKTDLRKTNILKEKMKNSFLNLGKTIDVNYEAIWKNMRENVENQYSGNDLEIVKKFFDDLEKNNNGNYNICVDDVFELQKFGSDPTYYGRMKNQYDINIGQKIKDATKPGVAQKLTSFLSNAFSYFVTGVWKTPKELKKYLISKGYRTKSAMRTWLTRYFAINIVFPFLGAVSEWVYYGYQKVKEKETGIELTSQGKKEFSEYAKEWYTQGLNGAIQENPSYWKTFATWFPGLLDNLIIGLIQKGQAGEDIDATKQQEKNLKDEVLKNDGNKLKDKINKFKERIGNAKNLDKKSEEFRTLTDFKREMNNYGYQDYGLNENDVILLETNTIIENGDMVFLNPKDGKEYFIVYNPDVNDKTIIYKWWDGNSYKDIDQIFK